MVQSTCYTISALLVIVAMAYGHPSIYTSNLRVHSFTRSYSHSVNEPIPSFSHSSSKSYQENSIPVLPPSAYKVDTDDAESLWPEGLRLPKSLQKPQRFLTHIDNDFQFNNFNEGYH